MRGVTPYLFATSDGNILNVDSISFISQTELKLGFIMTVDAPLAVTCNNENGSDP